MSRLPDMTAEEPGQLIHELLLELALCLNLPEGRLPALFSMEPGADHQQWLEAVKRVASITSVEFARRIGHLRCHPAFLRLCQHLLVEFESERGWRALLNRLGAMYIESRIRGSTRWTAGSFQTMVDHARDAVGAPDADTIASALFEKHGVKLQPDRHARGLSPGQPLPGTGEPRSNDQDRPVVPEVELPKPALDNSSVQGFDPLVARMLRAPREEPPPVSALQMKVEALENIIREAELLRAGGASLEQVIGVIEPVLEEICVPLMQSLEVEDQQFWGEFHHTEYFIERGVVLVDQSNRIPGTCLVLLTNGRLAEIYRHGKPEKWKATMTLISTQAALARYDLVSCQESIIRGLRGLMRLLRGKL